ncbi:MAG: hypothetical protein Q8W45_05150 [Candidatus Palauibacterales bacterium]|nr:hypothetical protein [Candidatus Palauibacterales bacterium]MDP2482645.1 hypothetical protein [Candidatus Palauibacterales bacterium]
MTIARCRAWRLAAPLNVALVAFVLFFAGLRIARSRTVFYYTEGPVLGSLAALESRGDLTDLYPSDGWAEPPVVLTLYPPVHFLFAAAVDGWLGTDGSFVGLRMISAAAFLCVLGLLVAQTIRSRAPPAWILALSAAVLLTPGVYRLAAAAQVDVLALAFTWAGVTAALDARDGRLRAGALPLALAATAFFFAFFSKQSFVAAPAALACCLLLARRVRAAAIFSISLAAAALLGMFALNAVTSGGYLANTLGALTGSSGWSNLAATLWSSRPLQWLPVAAVVLFISRGRLRLGFVEIYLMISTALHTAAMLKTGSSVNYLMEPAFALLLLAAVRGGPVVEPGARDPIGAAQGHRTKQQLAWLAACALGLSATAAAVHEVPLLRAWMASAGTARVAAFEGYPLVDPLFIPAVLQRDGRPWLNDPFAFGALEETGQWDPSRLVSDLEHGRVPFVLTPVDLGRGPAPEGRGTRELVMAYFWRSPRIWKAVTGSYRPMSTGRVKVWLPKEGEEAGPP